jgi:hypothetical protein
MPSDLQMTYGHSEAESSEKTSNNARYNSK